MPYGLTVERYDAMLTAQNGKCALCGYLPSERKRLAVDHNHESNQIRGLLCRWCNQYLGWLGDTPARISRVLSYAEGGFDALRYSDCS